MNKLFKDSEDSLVEQPSLEIFQSLNWKTYNAFDETNDTDKPYERDGRNDVILKSTLYKSLQKLNPKCSDEVLLLAIDELNRDRSLISPIKANEEIYKILKEGLSLSIQHEGKQEIKKVYFIDWIDVHNNDFLLVNQFWITGDLYTRRPDLIGFVNGIPLILFELKSPTEDILSGFNDNIKDYKDTIPKLFNYNAFIVVSNGSKTRIGSTFAGWEHYAEWKKINSEGEKGIISLDTVIKGTCSKERLLDIIENYILFIEEKGGLVKIISKYHQYFGVENAIKTLGGTEKNNQRLGVFWHTQGSG